MLKWRFPYLNDADFEFKEGEQETMFQKLAAKLKISRKAMDSLLAELQLY
ncbi:hypothetical protein GCM10008106_15450 [Mongoliitalea lutea]|uniref:Uncharacterized protein n=2 Tax=Cyclobacteriaceae TaxID=563798 RepID=A0A8J3G572_9BACT|nr:hypothetical protein GCM10008106_15450 [Mongoliitalea lutea]